MPNLVTVTRFLEAVSADFCDLQRAIVAAKESRQWTPDASQAEAFLVGLMRPVIREIIKEEIRLACEGTEREDNVFPQRNRNGSWP